MPDPSASLRRPAASAVLTLALLLGASSAVAALDEASYPEYEKAARTILCDCGCHPQSVHECACGRAAEMRRDVATLVEQGKSGDDVVAFYVERFGEKIRIAPLARGFNLVAWLGPFVGLLAASALLVLLVRRWSRRRQSLPVAAEPAAAVSAADADALYHARLRRELEDWR